MTKGFQDAKKSKGGFNRWSYNQIVEIWKTIEGGGGGTQVPSDWSATSGVKEIKNKPQINEKDLKSGNNTLDDLGIQEKLVSGENIKKLKVNNTTHDITGEGTIEITTGGSGTGDYSDLTNKPQIEGNELVGDKSAEDLGLAKKSHIHQIEDVDSLNATINAILNTKQDNLIGEGENQNLKTVDGQSLLGKGDIETGTPMLKADYALTTNDVILNADDYDDGFLWLTGVGTYTSNAHIVKTVDGKKEWADYRQPSVRATLPELTTVENGELVIIFKSATITSNDDVYKAVIHDEDREWVLLSDGGLNYLDLLNKPLVNGKVLEGNRTLEELDIQPKLVSGTNIQKLKVNDTTYDLNTEGTIEITTGSETETGDYTKLNNLPRINNVLLKKEDSVDFTLTDLGIPVPSPQGKVILSRSTPFVKMVKKDTLWMDVALLAADTGSHFTKILEETEEGGVIKKQWKPYNDVQQVIVDTLPSPSDEDYTDKCLCVVRVKNHAACCWEVYQLDKSEPEWVRLEATYGYTQLQDKPNINGVRVAGDKDLEDYGIQAELIGSGEGQNIKTINGQSILGSGNIEIRGDSEKRAVITKNTTIQPDPNIYPDGSYWITCENPEDPQIFINIIVESTKRWGEYTGAFAWGAELPEVTTRINGEVFVRADPITEDSPVYAADLYNKKWVRLDVLEEDYTTLINKPQIEGHELTGNKTADELGLATIDYVDNIQDTIIIPKKEKLPDVYQNYAVKESGDGKRPRTAVRTRVESYPLCPDGGTIMWMDDHYAPANDEINKNMTLLMNPATQRTLEFKESSTVMFKVAAHKKFTIKGVNFKLHDGTKYFFNELVVDNTTDNVINIDENYIEEHYEPVLMAASDVLSANNYEEYIILPDGEAEKIGDDTTDYNELEEDTLPQIEGNILKGNKSSADLGLASSDAVKTLENELTNVKKNVATDFYKTSTVKAPSCKAVADYIDSVLAGLDGSEEEF